MNTSSSKIKSLVAVIQLNSGEDHQLNYDEISHYVEDCVQRGAKLICLPDRFAYQAMKGNTWCENPETGKWFAKYRQMALENQVWLSLGGFPEQCQLSKNNKQMYYETHYIINSEGQIHSKYRKMHNYVANLDTKGGVNTTENKYQLLGDNIIEPCFSPVGYLGLSISYDLRFPELYRRLTLSGAQVLLIPSAFTAKTGASHWETLLRTRAIEN